MTTATVYSVKVNWSSDSPALGIDDDIVSFRERYPAVTFTRDPAYVPGPGSGQWPAIIIASPSLPAFQAAVREFAIGPLDDLQQVREHWQYNPRTGVVSVASFDWTTADGLRVATDVEIED